MGKSKLEGVSCSRNELKVAKQMPKYSAIESQGKEMEGKKLYTWRAVLATGSIFAVGLALWFVTWGDFGSHYWTRSRVATAAVVLPIVGALFGAIFWAVFSRIWASTISRRKHND